MWLQEAKVGGKLNKILRLTSPTFHLLVLILSPFLDLVFTSTGAHLAKTTLIQEKVTSVDWK